MASAPQSLNLFACQGRTDALRAISLTVLSLRSQGWTCPQLGKVLDCHADTVERASNEDTMLGFESIIRLCQAFPDEAERVRQLLDGPREPPTAKDRLDRIERETAALRKEMTG